MKLEYPKDWFEKSAAIEGAAEVGAGVPAAAASPLLERMLARHDLTENLCWTLEEELPCEPMDEAMLARMNQALGFSGLHAKPRGYRPYCVREGCEYMPRMFRVAEGFRCWSCNNVWDLRSAAVPEPQPQPQPL